MKHLEITLRSGSELDDSSLARTKNSMRQWTAGFTWGVGFVIWAFIAVVILWK